MSYGLPSRGQPDWDDELNNSIENLRGKADAAAADASNAVSTANSATNLALAADARSRMAVGRTVADVLGEPLGAAELDSSGRLPEGQVPDRLTEPSLNATFDPLRAPASNPNSFIANGTGNIIEDVPERAKDARNSHVEGIGCVVHDYSGHAEGSVSFAEGKISHAEGNACLCAGNDSHAEGNLTQTGRRFYPNVTSGSEDAGDGLGVMEYVLIPDAEGDVTSFFPNLLTDNITTRYGAGASTDVKGNVYASGFTPAVWSGDTVTTNNSLTWAMHTVCIIRGSGESEWQLTKIAKATYTAGTGTKVYYFGAKPFGTIKSILGSYSPVVAVSSGVLTMDGGGRGGGNGQHAEGFFTSAASGYGAHSEGFYTRAWANGAHSEGERAQALGNAAHAEGTDTVASGNNGSHAEGHFSAASGKTAHAEGFDCKAQGDFSHAEGWTTTASGLHSHAEGRQSTASGDHSHAEGYLNNATGAASHAEGAATNATGLYSHAEGDTTSATARAAHSEGGYTTASGEASQASGWRSVASRPYQQAYASGRRSVDGDSQVSRLGYGKSCVDAGWHDIHLFNDLVDGRTYHFEAMIVGRQTAGATGAVGDSFSYVVRGLVTMAAGVMTVHGTPTVTLTGRTGTMAGDGTATGVRITAYNTGYGAAPADLIARLDSEAGRTFWVQSFTTVQEVA